MATELGVSLKCTAFKVNYRPSTREGVRGLVGIPGMPQPHLQQLRVLNASIVEGLAPDSKATRESMAKSRGSARHMLHWA